MDAEVGEVARAALSGVPASIVPASSDLFGRARVLIVDDRDSNVLLLETILRGEGVVSIEGLTDPRDAVARCLAFRPDVVLLDLHMPHMDGFEVMRELRERMPPDVFLPVVVLTADAMPESRLRALECGANDFLTKPIDRVEVVLRIRNLLETCVLYADAHERSLELRRELDARIAAEERSAKELRDCTDRLAEVVDGDGLRIVFQPIVELAGGAVVGVEALARFAPEPVRPPDEWFADAKAVGWQERLELLAVQRALSTMDYATNDWFVSVNVSPSTATSRDLEPLLAAFPTERVVLELTEHEVIDDYEDLRPWLDLYRAQGARVAVDDAGAGYASLHHILSLEPEILKLDLQLIRGIDTDIARRALARCLVEFAQEIGAEVLAEGISSASELEVLRAVGVTLGQGYYLGRPAADLPPCFGFASQESER